MAPVQNALQVNFEAILNFPNQGMVNMFKALESLGLRGFLGCSTADYEENIQEFFANDKLERNTVIRTVRGSSVVILEEIFAGSFQLSNEGLVVMSEFPERLIAQMRMEFSESLVPVHNYCMKKYIKVEYRLLHDIIAKALTAKVGPADPVTQIRFDMMDQGFSVQLILLLEGVPRLKLGESKALTSLKILYVKSVGTYVAKNKSTLAELVEKKKSTGDTVRPSSTKKSKGWRM
ncbi:hypothetical protein F511_19272 [Dorcoceras hygrometricum]|uniref:Uncharacterized protein n=1 Tax=Dorcoceras hygrometricum TaxID=472368 RepID=A0A2Z7D5M8_9LAMI|nr:hypothetical protein F511_19272 [Dorcoceras hygrometricum]